MTDASFQKEREERERVHNLSVNTDYYAEREMSYSQLVNHLLSKYGSSKADYFTDERCIKANPRAKRSGEGLICHHIDEDKVADLSKGEIAKKHLFEYQKAPRLVYCNLLEHLLLHVKITIEIPHNSDLKGLGAGGVVNYMCKDFNHFYSGKQFGMDFVVYQVNQMEAVEPENHFDEYVAIMRDLYKYFQEDPLWKDVPAAYLSRDRDDEVVDVVYQALIK